MEKVEKKTGFSYEKKWSTQDFKINVEGKKLTIFYTPKTKRAFYNISYNSGRVVAVGTILNEGITPVLLKFVERGDYQLQVIDGEDLIKDCISIDE